MAFNVNKIKGFDYSNKYNYLSDNDTVGTALYYQKKFGDKFSYHDYLILEIKSREGKTEADLDEALLIRKHHNALVAHEYNEILAGSMDPHYQLMHEIKNHYLHSRSVPKK